MKDIQIGQHPVGLTHPPFIIGEMSGNHNQSLDRALALVDAAADAGVHALKIQTYTADTMTLNVSNGDFYIDDPKSLWNGNSLYQLYQKAYTPWEWHEPIFKRCKEKGLLGFSTPFDLTAVDFLEKLDVPCYKVASFENTDLKLIEKVAATKKPMIISTGMASQEEIGEAIRTANAAGCKDLIILKCTSAYPADPQDSNLNTISDMRNTFQIQVGLSDHTLGIGTSLAAVALGATVIERHFTLKRKDGGVDAAFSLEPHELKTLVQESRQARASMGRVFYGPTEHEKPSLKYRRSLYFSKDLKAGEILTKDNVRIVRPGMGLAPKHYDAVLGKTTRSPVKKGTALSWDLLN